MSNKIKIASAIPSIADYCIKNLHSLVANTRWGGIGEIIRKIQKWAEVLGIEEFFYGDV